MRGTSSLDEILCKISDDTCIPVDELASKIHDRGLALVEVEILEKIYQLGCHAYVFLVSDNMEILTSCFREQRLQKYFDDVWFSCEQGMLKNEQRGIAYKMICESYNVDIRRSILFDDSWSSIETFGEVGGTGIKVSGVADTQKYLDILNSQHARRATTAA